MPGFWLGTSRRYIGSTPLLDSGPVSEYGAIFCRNGELEGRSIRVESPGFSGDWGRGLSHAPAAPHPGGGQAPALHFPLPPLAGDRASTARSASADSRKEQAPLNLNTYRHLLTHFLSNDIFRMDLSVFRELGLARLRG